MHRLGNDGQPYAGTAPEEYAAIISKNASIEILLKKRTVERGFRYRVDCMDVFGRLDILFPKKKVAMFCDSEFWHGYECESHKEEIGTNRDYWIPKIEWNMKRDREVNSILESQGYTAIGFGGKR